MSRDSDKKKNNKKHREEIRNISSIENGTSRAYRQKVLVRQAGKLVDELERARREEQETQADGIIRQKVVKRKSTRIAYRVVGIIFVLAGIAVVGYGRSLQNDKGCYCDCGHGIWILCGQGFI